MDSARKMAEEALAEIAAGDHGEYCGLRNGMLLSGGKTECYSDCPKRVAKEALEALLAAGPEAPPPPSDAVREAAEIIRAILTGHSARLSERGVLIYGPPRSNTGFPAAIEWLRRYAAARGGE